ncbi:MAG: phage head morphogenesis protein, partial [Clostridium sp.]|nr:phage head morphogenesis protein [Clostridium sp.]
WSRNKIREKLGPGYARKYIGGLDYEALRLARTTLTHQAQIAVINSSKINPYLQFVKWHSDHQAGRTCQQCIDRDGQLFKIDEVPLDHPNGMCWIQPVYSIDGKTEATPEEIARDMKAWAEGSKNSKLMDKIPEYKGLGGTHKVKEKPKEKGLVFTDEERTKQYRKFKRFLQRELPEMGPEYNVDALILRLQQAPKNVQDMYLTVGGKFKIVDSNKPGAYYSPGDKKIHMSLRDKHNNKIRFGDEHRYDVLFHEWGHLMDNQWKKKTSKFMKFKGRDVSTKLSTKSKLCASLEEDMNNWMDNYAKTKFPGRKAPPTLLKNKFNEFLNANEKHTIAIQDGIRGITGGDIRTRWGHDLKYYKRNVAGKLTEKDSVHLEVSSELFAEVSAGMMHEDTRQFLETNFPNLTKEYNNMVDTMLKQYLKDMEGW